MDGLFTSDFGISNRLIIMPLKPSKCDLSTIHCVLDLRLKKSMSYLKQQVGLRDFFELHQTFSVKSGTYTLVVLSSWVRVCVCNQSIMMIPTTLTPYTVITHTGHANMSTMFGTYISSAVDEGPHPISSPQESFLVQGVPNGRSLQIPSLIRSLSTYFIVFLMHVFPRRGNGHWERNEPKRIGLTN